MSVVFFHTRSLTQMVNFFDSWYERYAVDDHNLELPPGNVYYCIYYLDYVYG
jgi:hypothetical protein